MLLAWGLAGCLFDPKAFVGFVIQVFQSLLCSCIVASILNFSHVSVGALCMRMKLGEVEASVIESVLDINVMLPGRISLIMVASYKEKSIKVNAQPCLRPLVTGNGSERTS